MKDNVTLIFVIFFIILVIFTSRSYSNFSQFNNKNNNSTISIKQDPCFLYENINRTQLLYVKLRNVLDKISKKPCNIKTLGTNCEEETYIQGTTSNRLKTELKEVTDIVLKNIHKISGFFFKVVYFDVVKVITDKKGNKNFRYNVFVYDTNEELQVRLYIDVIKYIVNCPKKPQQKTCTSATLPGMKFEAGYPQPEQLIPLPTQTVNTGAGGFAISNKGIDIIEIPPIKALYLNKVKIFDTNAVINADGKCLPESVCGNLPDTTLDESRYNGISTPFQDPSIVRNPWAKLYDEPKGVKAWPCATPSECWNNDGIPNPSTCNSQVAGLRSSTTQFPITPFFTNSLFVLPRWSGLYANLFSLTRGDPATEGADFTQ